MSSAECLSLSSVLPGLEGPQKSPIAPPRIAPSRIEPFRIEPLQDPRWERFVQGHPDSSLFHSTAWLKALAETYQYSPAALVVPCPGGDNFRGGLVYCQVESWLTGRRLVSLPFSDHCEPLLDSIEDTNAIASALEREFRRSHWRYVEMRPMQRIAPALNLPQSTIPYTLHRLDLTPAVETLFKNCHKDSTQRKIRRAEREGLQYREGSSPELLDLFYRMHALNRQRHHRPPQPRMWFHQLVEGFGSDLHVRVAFHHSRAVAAILTIRHKDTLVYKYGGSDPQFNNLGSMHLLLWGAILDAKSAGMRWFDFGRTEADQQGLITFKKRWGSLQSELVYTRFGEVDRVTPMFEQASEGWKSKLIKSLLSHMRPGALSVAGRALYKHVG